MHPSQSLPAAVNTLDYRRNNSSRSFLRLFFRLVFVFSIWATQRAATTVWPFDVIVASKECNVSFEFRWKNYETPARWRRGDRHIAAGYKCVLESLLNGDVNIK